MRCFISSWLIVFSLAVSASHQLTYYIYYETSYNQGPWSRADALEKSGYNYLAVQEYTDLFGTIREELIYKMISRLKERKPTYYDWNFEISLAGDSITIISKEGISNLETVRNEITATLTLNGFEAVTFNFQDQQETWTLDDLTLPYFDLVTGQAMAGNKEISDNKNQSNELVYSDTVIVRVTDTLKYLESVSRPITEVQNEEDDWITLLIISALINAGFIGFLIYRKRSEPIDLKPKKRHGLVTAWLVFMMFNFMMSILFYFVLVDIYETYLKMNMPEPIEMAFGVLSLVNLVLVIMLFRWKKWAFYGFLVTSIITFILSISADLSIARSMISPTAIVVLYAVLQIKKDGVSAWDFLE